MRPMPINQLNPKIKSVWRITDSISVALPFLLVIIPLFFVGLDPNMGVVRTINLVLVAIMVLAIVLVAIILPPIRYMRWRYEVGENELDIARGIIWRKRFIIPFVRVQNTDTRQGPILRAFNLASVTVSTAAGSHEIPGLSFEEADALRDLIATQARLAQEDV